MLRRTIIRPTLARLHAQHSHSHSHSHANPFLSFSIREIKRNPAVRITWIGLGTNIGMVLGKIVGGLTFHSQALLADAVHAMSDLVSDLLTLVSVGFGDKKANASFPYGYGKIDTLGSVAVSGILTAAGASIGWTSLCAIAGPLMPQAVLETAASMFHIHSHTRISEIPQIGAAWIAGVSIVAKEWVFQATKRVAIRTKSNVLMANAWHHRVDSLTSFVALAAITSSHWFGFHALDDLGGLIVSGVILRTGLHGLRSAILELADSALEADDPRFIKIQKSLTLGLEENGDITSLYVLPSGPSVRAKAVIRLHSDISSSELQHLDKNLRESIGGTVGLDVRYINQVIDKK